MGFDAQRGGSSKWRGVRAKGSETPPPPPPPSSSRCVAGPDETYHSRSRLQAGHDKKETNKRQRVLAGMEALFERVRRSFADAVVGSPGRCAWSANNSSATTTSW